MKRAATDMASSALIDSMGGIGVRRGRFVGREREFSLLRSSLENTFDRQGGIALVCGEPGIGKTRLAEEIAEFARESGAWVSFGRGWEGDGAPAFWPWMQILKAYVLGHDAAQVVELMGASAKEIVRFMPEMRTFLPQYSDSGTQGFESDEIRFRVFDGVVTFLRNAGEARPLVIVLDDLHWADTPSLVLLEYLAGVVRGSRLLIIGTYRDAEIGAGHPLSRTLGELARCGLTQHLYLKGLSKKDVACFLGAASEKAAQMAVVAAVYEKTEGNPFFVTELVRLLETDGATNATHIQPVRLAIPRTVRDVIRRRIAKLDAETREVLEIASVVGREFDLSLLQCISAKPALRILEFLDHAQLAQLVTELPEGMGRYRFAHILIRDDIYEGLGALRRTQLHCAIGLVLEELHAGDIESSLELLAHHFCNGVVGGDQDRAVRYSVRAGQRAAGSLAYEEAIEHYRNAYRIINANPQVHDERERCEILLAMGEAENRAGEWLSARGSFQRGAKLARCIGDAELFARAAIGFKGIIGATGPVDVDAVGLLREALVGLKGESASLRVRVLSELAISLYFAEDVQERDKKSAEAVALARGLGEPATLGNALKARIHSLWRPSGLLEMLDTASEIIQLSGISTSTDLAFVGQLFRHVCLLSLGDVVLCGSALDACVSLSEESRHPRYLWQATLARGAWALSKGEMIETRRLACAANDIGHRVHDSSTEHYCLLQAFFMARIEGKLATVGEQLEAAAKKYPRLPWYLIGLAAVYSFCEKEDDARRILELIERCGFYPLPDNMFLLFSLSILSEVNCRLSNIREAESLYSQMIPYANHNIVVSWGAACDGSVSHYLGLLARTLGRMDDAVRHFDDALEMNQRMKFVPFVARTQHHYAAILLELKQGRDRERALRMLSDAIETYRRLGMEGYLRDALKVADSVSELSGLCEAIQNGSVPARGDLSGGQGEDVVSSTHGRTGETSLSPSESAQGNVFRREGEYWTVRYRGRIVRLKNMRGLEYIACLLGQPGKEVHSLDLSTLINRGWSAGVGRDGAGQPSGEDRLSVARLGDAGPLLDSQSRLKYRGRIGALRREVAEAERLNDVLKASAARREMEILARELSAGTRRGGGPRLAGSYAERARVNVRNNISSALRAIRRHDEELWRHLYRGVRTGTYCAYIPEAGVDWQL